MIPKLTGRKEPSHLTNFARAAAFIVSVSLLTGCSIVPDWANPMELYENIAQKISGTGGTGSKEEAPRVIKKGDIKFPNLGSVPKRPTILTEAQRNRLSNSLKADRTNARYSRAKILEQVNSPVKQTPNKYVGKSLRPLPSKSKVSETAAVSSAPSSGASVASPSRKSGAPKFSLMPREANKQVSPDRRFVRPMVKRARPGARSVARVGNPIFGAPPADIIAAHGGVAGSPLGSRQLSGVVARVDTSVGTVRFTSGSAALTQASKTVLRRIVQEFGKRGGRLRVEGHASSRTRNMDMVKHHMVNFDVSFRRVNTVAKELVRLGIPSQSVLVTALSDSRPIYDEIMPAHDAGNQRVEIYFVK